MLLKFYHFHRINKLILTLLFSLYFLFILLRTFNITIKKTLKQFTPAVEQKLNSTVHQQSTITKPRKRKTDTLSKPLLPPSEHITTTPKLTSTENTQVYFKKPQCSYPFSLYLKNFFYFIFFFHFIYYFNVVFNT